MPAYNAADTITESISSLVTQSRPPSSIIVVNDCSTDGTLEVLNDLGEQYPAVQIVNNKQRLGVTASLNIGLEFCRGDYIARQDADDISMPDRFRKQAEILDQNAQVGVVGCWPEFINTTKPGKVKTYPIKHEVIARKLKYRNVISHGSAMIRREVFDTIGNYRQFFRLSQDRDLWLRASEQWKLENIPEPLYRFRVGNDDEVLQKARARYGYQKIISFCAYQRANHGIDSLGLRVGSKYVEEKSLVSMNRIFSQSSLKLYLSAFRHSVEGRSAAFRIKSILAIILWPSHHRIESELE